MVSQKLLNAIIVLSFVFTIVDVLDIIMYSNVSRLPGLLNLLVHSNMENDNAHDK